MQGESRRQHPLDQRIGSGTDQRCTQGHALGVVLLLPPLFPITERNKLVPVVIMFSSSS